MTVPQPRPRVVDAAYWTWLAAAALLVLLGGIIWFSTSTDAIRQAYAKTVTDEEIRTVASFIRDVGFICIMVGLGVAYLAVRIRKGEKRFRRAALVVSIVAVMALLVCAGMFGLPLLTLPVLALIVAIVFVTRPAAVAWFDAEQPPGGGGG